MDLVFQVLTHQVKWQWKTEQWEPQIEMEGICEDPEQNIFTLLTQRPAMCYLWDGSWYHPPVREAQTPERRMSSIWEPIIILWCGHTHSWSKNIALSGFVLFCAKLRYGNGLDGLELNPSLFLLLSATQEIFITLDFSSIMQFLVDGEMSFQSNERVDGRLGWVGLNPIYMD